MRHLVRDPVHFTVPMSSEERAVIDHPLFQRLRRIKQTAFLYLVFPGATHDRFSHSIGAMHVAGLVFDRIADEFVETYGPRALQPTQRDYFRRLIRLAALLHDVGHGPFSHSLEGVNNAGRPIHPIRKAFLEEGVIPDHWIDPKYMSGKKAWLAQPTSHEDFSVAIIAMMANERGQLGGLEAQDIVAVLNEWVIPTQEFQLMNRVGPSGRWSLKAALKSMVSGELDVDRMDYLLRDSHYSGVPYGQYDREMLLGNMIWRPNPENPGEMCIALRRKSLHAFEDFLISRFHMFMQLYSHKTVIGFDVVLENALAELPDFHIDADLTEYVKWSDEWLLRKTLENRSSQWGQHIRDRVAPKHLFTVNQEHKDIFAKFIRPYEVSSGTTAWFPSLKSKARPKKIKGDVPKLWWRHTTSYLTKGVRGHFPVYLEERRKLVPMESLSLLLKSDYVRRFEMTHVYCLREDERKAIAWMVKAGISEHLLAPPKSLLDG
ncbi:MAG: HD domain-containing protein [Bdellovibrionales bacterium]|nr:HD domain-containing protein [Bdellovibrionales bacterium]